MILGHQPQAILHLSPDEQMLALKTTESFMNLDKVEQLKLLKDPTK